MDLSKLRRGEIVAIIGGIVLALGLFLHWYSSVSDLATIAGHKGKGSYTGWDVHTTMRYLLLAAAVAPLILAWIIVRDHTLSWPRGQLTSVIAIAAIGLLFYNGIVSRPGDPNSQIHLQIGWIVAFVGAALMLTGSVMRQQETEMKRKPPGVI